MGHDDWQECVAFSRSVLCHVMCNMCHVLWCMSSFIVMCGGVFGNEYLCCVSVFVDCGGFLGGIYWMVNGSQYKSDLDHIYVRLNGQN